MLLLKVVTAVVLALAGVNGVNVALNGLLRRVFDENGLKVAYVIGRGDRFFDEVLSEDVAVPVVVLRNLSHEYRGQFRMVEHGVVVIEAIPEGPNYIKNTQRLIADLRLRKYVIVVSTSTEDLWQYFEFLTEHKFTRLFGVAGGVQYAYFPYSDNKLVEFSLRDPLPDALKDLNGYPVRITAIDDLPRVYKSTDEHGREKLTGYAGELFLRFLLKHNATYAEIQLDNVAHQFMTILVNATVSGKIDFSVNPYDAMAGVEMSYPIYLLKWSIMVPIVESLNPTQYFVRPFTPIVWICLGFTLIFIIAMDLIKARLTHAPVNVWEATSQTMLAMFSMSTERPIRRAYRFHFQVILFGFVVGNLYTTLLKSFLTVFIKVKQSETIQDMIENHIRLMMVEYEWEPEKFIEDLKKIVLPVENSVFLRERNAMNTDFAYAVGMDKGLYLIHMQSTYAKPQFHIIRDSLESYFVGFLLAEHSPFLEILNNFIIEVQATGLMEKWSHDAVKWGLYAGLVNATRTAKEPLTALTLNHFYFAWLALGCGLTISTMVFLAELKLCWFK